MNSEPSLTSLAALEVLITDLEAAVSRFYQRNKRTPFTIFKAVVFDNPFTFWPNFLYTALTCALTVLVFFVSTDIWFLAEVFLIAVVIFFNTGFVVADSIHAREEYAKKVEHLIEYLKSQDSSKLEACDFRNIEFFPSVSSHRIVRNDQIHVLPSAVAVRGDIICLQPGERPPCSATYLPDFVLPASQKKNSVTSNSVDSGLKASDLLSDRTSTVPYPNPNYYKLNETPIVLKIEELVLGSSKQRVPAPILGLIRSIQTWHFFVVVPATLGISIMFVGLTSFAHGYTTFTNVISDLFPFIIHSVFAISIPLLPTMLTLLRIHGNALIVDESRKLQTTRNERSDSGADEAYEHVEVIRPTDLFSSSKLQMFRQLLNGGLPESLPRNGNILFGFANLNYLCAIDKEGIVSTSKPVLQKLLIFSSAQPAHTISQSSAANMPRNVSFGTFMSSDTVSSGQGKHCRLETLHAITKMQNGSLRLDFDEKQWLRHMGVLKAIGLNMVVTSSQIYTEHCRSFLSYLTNPFVGTTLEPNISSGNQASMMTTASGANSTAPHIDVVNMHMFIPLTERIGFRTEQTLSNYKVEEFVGIYSSAWPLPLRRAFATVCRDVSSSSLANSLQLFCQGQPDLIFSMCSDFWDGNDLHPFTPGIRARVRDFCNRSSQTGHCVALSYSPLNQTIRQFHRDACLRFVPKSDFPLSVTASPQLAASAHTLSPSWADVVEDSNQIFIGVAVLSSQPLMPVIQIIQNLKAACCRFVYFSQESELMSRAFAEKLGLEANWNCFISLADSAKTDNESCHNQPNHYEVIDESAELIPTPKSFSYNPQVSIDESVENHSQITESYVPNRRHRQTSTTSGAPVVSIKTSSSAPNISLFALEENSDEQLGSGQVSPLEYQGSKTSSQSSLASHASSDQIWKIENHAQLPRGIKEVRPHIEKCDNVPLLVSLFTDCSQSSTNEMMSIMAENNSVVCSIGSSLVAGNIMSFAKTDCAVSVLPLTPVTPGQFSQSIRSSLSGSTMHSAPFAKQFNAAISAGLQQQSRDMYLDIASQLISLPCPLIIRPGRICYLLQMIAQSRHYVLCIKQVFFYASFAYGTLVLTHFAHLATDRPLPVSPLLFMWLTIFAIPALASSLISAPIDLDILKQPPHRARVTSATVAATMCYFLATFLPAVPLCLGLTVLFDFLLWKEFSLTPIPLDCGRVEAIGNATAQQSSPVVFSDKYQFIPPWWKVSEGLPEHCEFDSTFSANFQVLSSELSSIFLGVYLLVLSAGFVFPLDPLWRQNPLVKTRSYCILLAVLIFGTVILGLSHIFAATIGESPSFVDVSPISWALSIVFPLIISLPTHELFKLRRTRKIIRQLKRIRLEFNTRLGLNSPF